VLVLSVITDVPSCWYQVGRGRPDAYDEVKASRRPRRRKGHKKQYLY
jgi:hypothetical protein